MMNQALHAVKALAVQEVSYVLTLDDDPLVAKLIEKTLALPTLNFENPNDLVSKLPSLNPRAIFLDIHLPESSGLSLIPILREHWPFIPLIVITADKNEAKISEALALGADDFIQKPLKASEIKARLQKRWQDNQEKQSQSIVGLEDITLDTAHNLVKGPSSTRNLSPTEANLLARLIQAKGTSVSRSSLKFSCWQNINVTENALDRKIYETRKALSDIGSQLEIETIYGEGFRLKSKDLTK